jgi:hypothetical protein
MKKLVTLCMLVAFLSPFLIACSAKEEPKSERQKAEQEEAHKKAISTTVNVHDPKGW